MYFCYKSTIYLNQRYVTIKDNKRLYYADYYILGQIIECLNPPEDISNYVCKDVTVKIYRRRYDTVTEHFWDFAKPWVTSGCEVTLMNIFLTMAFVKRTQKYYILIIKEGFQVLSVGHFLIGTKYSLKEAVYRPHFQRFIISYLLLLLMEVNKLTTFGVCKPFSCRYT